MRNRRPTSRACGGRKEGRQRRERMWPPPHGSKETTAFIPRRPEASSANFQAPLLFFGAAATNKEALLRCRAATDWPVGPARPWCGSLVCFERRVQRGDAEEENTWSACQTQPNLLLSLSLCYCCCWVTCLSSSSARSIVFFFSYSMAASA